MSPQAQKRGIVWRTISMLSGPEKSQEEQLSLIIILYYHASLLLTH